MKRAEFVQRLVLNAMCDDFENVDQIILPTVATVGGKCGLAINRSEVVEALRALVENGFAKAYDLSATGDSPFSGELQGMPPMDLVEDDFTFKTYFYITKQGIEFHRSKSAWWPLTDDDDEALRPDWIPPED